MHSVDPFQHGTPVQVRLQESLFDAVEAWRRRRKIIPSRPEAIRQLLSMSLVEQGGLPVQGAAAETNESLLQQAMSPRQEEVPSNLHSKEREIKVPDF